MEGYLVWTETLDVCNQAIDDLDVEVDEVNKNRRRGPAGDMGIYKLHSMSDSQAYCYEWAHNRKFVFALLEQKIIDMESKGYDQLTEADKKILERTYQDLNQMKDEKLQGVMLRSKTRWYNEGEASTKYFYNLERAKSSSKEYELRFTWKWRGNKET